MEASVSFLNFSPHLAALIVLTSSSQLSKFEISPEGKLDKGQTTKIGRGNRCAEWMGNDLIAVVDNGPKVRLYHLDVDEEYVLKLDRTSSMTCVAFEPKNQLLAAGTKHGAVAIWKRHRASASTHHNSAVDWTLLSVLNTNREVFSLQWGGSCAGAQLAVAFQNSCSIFHQAVLQSARGGGHSVSQSSVHGITIQTLEEQTQLETAIRIQGMAVGSGLLVMWSGKRADVRRIGQGVPQTVVGFDTAAVAAAVFHETLYLASEKGVEIWQADGDSRPKSMFVFSSHERRQQGEKSQAIVEESRTEGVHLHCNGHFLVVAAWGRVILWDISSPESPKEIQTLRVEHIVACVRVNCDGSSISVISRSATGGANSLHVYDREEGVWTQHAVRPGLSPVMHYWDNEETTLLAVECEVLDAATASGSDEVEISLLLLTDKNELLLQDAFHMQGQRCLRGLEAPLVWLSTHSGTPADGVRTEMYARTLRPFKPTDLQAGKDQSDKQTVNLRTKSIFKFCCCLLSGMLQEAFSLAKRLDGRDEATQREQDSGGGCLWLRMAKACVGNRRLDVATICLEEAKHIRALCALRAAAQVPEVEARLGVLAVQLGMDLEAERLFGQCGRFDLLVAQYQAGGRWQAAITTAEAHARILRKTVHFQWARHLESLGDTAGAIEHYQKADLHRREVPRMLAGKMQELEAYIKASKDMTLLIWWGKYCESNERYDDASQAYTQAKDWLAVVRLCCSQGDRARAAQIASQTSHLPSYYHLARHCQAKKQMAMAINFYTKAQTLRPAIRLARSEGLDDELLSLALQWTGDGQHIVQHARYFETKGLFAHAASLYHKCGRLSQAVHLCVRENLSDPLRSIVDGLGDDTAPELLRKCARFFSDRKEFGRAVNLLILMKLHAQALSLCTEHGVALTPHIVEAITPPKGKDEASRAARAGVLLGLAEACKGQELFSLACKKFTQAGEKLAAMHCLLRTEDTEQIIYYANNTKNREVCLLAAQYLEETDWHTDSTVIDHIIQLYTKAKATERLAAFYESWAQLEILEYEDYEKALLSLKAALKYVIRTKDITHKEDRLASLHSRIRLFERFLEARGLHKRDPARMAVICNELLETPGVESVLRIENVYELLVHYHHACGDVQMTYRVIERMREADIVVTDYVPAEMVESIRSALASAAEQSSI